MNRTAAVEAHLDLLGWGCWDPAEPPELVHAVVPSTFSDAMPLAALQADPHTWHAVVNNLIMDADARFGHRHWFDTQYQWREGIASGAHGGMFYAYQRLHRSDDRIATVSCYPDGTIISRSWIVGAHLSPPQKKVTIEEVADSLAATMWFASNLYVAVAPHASFECLVRSALASANDFKLHVPAGPHDLEVVQKDPARFLPVPGELELRYPDERLEQRIRSIASWPYCWEHLKPLYRGDAPTQR